MLGSLQLKVLLLKTLEPRDPSGEITHGEVGEVQTRLHTSSLNHLTQNRKTRYPLFENTLIIKQETYILWPTLSSFPTPPRLAVRLPALCICPQTQL